MTTAAAPAPPGAWSVQRAGLASRIGSSALVLVAIALFAVPQILSANVVQQLTSLLVFLILAVMWNALAGYAGLVSVGQQAFIGFGAYGTIYLTQRGIQPYLAVVLASLASAVLAAVLSLLVLRLRGGQFAVGTWVVAEAIALFVMLDQSLGGGTGVSLQGLSGYAPEVRRAFTYWLTLAFAVLLLVLLFLLLRHRTGAALQAIRDDEDAAASLGVRVRPLKLMLFVLAGFGCGAAGALTLANTLFIQPQSIFGVQWSAYMIFMVLVGGIGTFEGPIIGAVLFFAVQYFFADQGAWYLIGLGLAAVAFALFLPRGLWSLLNDRLHVQLLPVGYHLRRQGARPRSSSRET
ncbi:branched-chain amino acid ABC transporter permease [Streptomyces fuscichromogenes]|uniref:Branched-chain amino acid ABC transporter permease n=1 Tax=Streptomyces fuscichromogenes TaxID=1324013 RepID=A0A917UHM8_9ACTN|nr:branched-chain amino acid ABC transporter permease [Streptomyces fuscichromogenes]GGM94449.1 branched-chain amino acid ABC transporter permease [Streptomyces fuscichromogenes]